jgi:site-specific DNA-methyltransferase (adenine-specific)
MPELTLYNGDCLEIMKELPEKSVDLIICDLPYGCLSTQGNKNLMRCEPGREHIPRCDNTNVKGCSWDIKIDLKAFWEQVRRIRKNEHTPTIHFCTTKFGYELIQSNPDEFRYDLVWDKQRGVSFLSANKMPMRSHEMIYVFSKAGAFYERRDIEGEFKQSSGGRDKSATPSAQYGATKKTVTHNEGKRCVLSVIKNKTSTSKGGHPTEKPEDLYRFLIERYCPPGGTVLDPTFGSGNSVFTAFAMGRSAIGIEKDTSFYTKAEKRLQDLP